MTGNDDQGALQRENHVGLADGEFQQHLIHIGVTVARHRNDAVGVLIQQPGASGRVIAGGNRIAGAVVQQVSQKDQRSGFLRAETLQGLLQPLGVSVDI